MKTRLQELRKAAGFKSAKAFAESYGVNLNTYTGYEQGKPLSLEQAWAFADYFDCSLDELAGRDRPKRDYPDPQQAQLNAMYERLEDSGKSAALGSVRGILDQQGREKSSGQDSRAGYNGDGRRTA